MAKGLPGVRLVEPATIGSGVRLRELIHVPVWLLMLGRAVLWLFVHPVLTGALLLVLVVWYRTNSWLWGVLALVGALLGYVLGVSLVRARSCSYASLREAFLS